MEVAALQKTPVKETPKKAAVKLRAKKMSAGKSASPISVTLSATPRKTSRTQQAEVTTLQKAPRMDTATLQLLNNLSADADLGLLPRFIKAIFARIGKKGLDVVVSCSFMQVQHEEIFDLLPGDSTSSSGAGFM